MCTAPLAMIASALQCEDVLADPAWIMQVCVRGQGQGKGLITCLICVSN